jgi:hypothetical protein
MTRPRTPFQLADVISGEPHLYVSHPATRALDCELIEADQRALSKSRVRFTQAAATLLGRLRAYSTSQEALGAATGKALDP